MGEEQRLARISELEALCAGQAFDRGKNIAEIMAEHIVVKEQKVAALTREVAGLRAALREVEWLPGPHYTHDKVMECPCCLQADYQGHAGDCLIGCALSATTKETTDGD